jgi:hypothetical protein
MTMTYWNGEPCEARRVVVKVGDTGRFPKAWYRELVGQERNAVEVTYAGQTFYLDDANGLGWAKVTIYQGSPSRGHGSLEIDEVIRERLDAAALVMCQDCQRWVEPRDGACPVCGHKWRAAVEVET